MNLLDWILVLLVVAYAVSGYWQGFISGAFSTVGLILGGLLGIWLAPILLGSRGPVAAGVSCWRLFVVLICASFGQAILQYVGGRARETITWQPARAVDAVGGAALSVVAVLVVTWMLGVAISGSRIPGVGPMVRDLRGAARGRHGDAGDGEDRAPGVQRRGRVELLPDLPRAVRPRAHRQRLRGAVAPAARPRHRARPRQRVQAPRQQQVRAWGRGQRVRLRPPPADDQRPRGGGCRPAEGRGRRQAPAGHGRLLQPRHRRRGARGARTSTRRGSGSTPGAAARTPRPPSATRRTGRSTPSRCGSGPSSG